LTQNRDLLLTLREDIKRLVAKYSPEELDVFDEMFDNIVSEADTIFECGEKILDSENTLGFFGSGILTLAITILITEIIRTFIRHSMKISAEGIRKIARRILGKATAELSDKEVEEIANELARILAKLKLSS